MSCLDGPVFIKKPEDISGDSGQKVVLGCMAAGNPPPSYRWLRNYDNTKVWIKSYYCNILKTMIMNHELQTKYS